jgi:hypothetical protein
MTRAYKPAVPSLSSDKLKSSDVLMTGDGAITVVLAAAMVGKRGLQLPTGARTSR